MPELPPQKLFCQIHRYGKANQLSRLCRAMQPWTEMRLQLYAQNVLWRKPDCQRAIERRICAGVKASHHSASCAILHWTGNHEAVTETVSHEQTVSVPEFPFRTGGYRRTDVTLPCGNLETLAGSYSLLAGGYFRAGTHRKSDALQSWERETD